MNEQVQQLVTDASEKVLAWLDATEGFAIEQAPILAQEIVRFGLWQHGIYAVACLGVVLGSFLFAGLSFTKRPCEFLIKHTDGAGYIVLILLFIPIVVGGVDGVQHAVEFLKAATAPRLYILEQIGGLL